MLIGPSFNFKFASFASLRCKCMACVRPLLELDTRPRFRPVQPAEVCLCFNLCIAYICGQNQSEFLLTLRGRFVEEKLELSFNFRCDQIPSNYLQEFGHTLLYYSSRTQMLTKRALAIQTYQNIIELSFNIVSASFCIVKLQSAVVHYYEACLKTEEEKEKR